MPLFGKSHKGPYELIKSLQESLLSIEKGDKKAEKALEDISKNLVLMKNMLYGTSE
ncbi:Mo25-like protein, partial [Leptotrombidium deliense]